MPKRNGNEKHFKISKQLNPSPNTKAFQIELIGMYIVQECIAKLFLSSQYLQVKIKYVKLK